MTRLDGSDDPDEPSVRSRAVSCPARLIDPRPDVRHKRHFSENDSAAPPAAISECRRACIAAQTNATIGVPIYRAVSRLMNEIDLMAEALTGDRRHLWLKPHGTPGSQQPKGPTGGFSARTG